VTADQSPAREKKLSNVEMRTLRVLMTDAAFVTDDGIQLKKPAFFFGDHIHDGGHRVHEGTYTWLRQIGGRRFFLPAMDRMYPMFYYQHMSVPRKMEFDLARYAPEVTLGDLGSHYQVHRHDGHDGSVIGLFPGSRKREIPSGEIPHIGTTFLNMFMAAEGDYPVAFRAYGWIHSPANYWWGRMVGFVLTELGDLLKRVGLYSAVRAVQWGIPQSSQNFFGILERYNPLTGTFFTPVGEMGLALHELHEVSGLVTGDMPYEEYVPTAVELRHVKEEFPLIYETYWEVLCHFHICGQITKWRSQGVTYLSWASYLFNNVNTKDHLITRLAPSSDREIEDRIDQAPEKFYTTESNEDGFDPDLVFESFHHQARTPISDRALLAGFLMLWLKRCVVPTLPHEVIVADVVYPAVLLAHGNPIALLPTVVAGIQSGLRALAKSFCEPPKTVDSEGKPLTDAEGNPVVKHPNPRVELPYTYLMAWYVMHCPSLMTAVRWKEDSVPFIQRLEGSRWEDPYIYYIRKRLSAPANYQLNRCLLQIPGASYGDLLVDSAGPDDFTRLSQGAFWWLLNIRPGYMLFRQGTSCTIEPYMPNRFARQFGYDQLYIGNPNAYLAFEGNLFEGARAWYYSVAGGTGTTFRLPLEAPKCQMSLSYCTWYSQAVQTPDFLPASSCIESINASLEARTESGKPTRLVEQYRKARKEVGRRTRREPRATEPRPPRAEPRAKNEPSVTRAEPSATREEPQTKRSRQLVSKRPYRSTSVVEPAPKKVKRDSAAEVSQSGAISAGVEAPPEDVVARVGESPEEEDFPLPVRAPRPHHEHREAVEEGEFIEESAVAADVASPEIEVMGNADVEIPGVAAQLKSPSAHERRDEAQQLGSPSVFIPSPRAVDPSPTTGVIGGKAPIVDSPRTDLSSSSFSGASMFEDEVDYGDEPAPPDQSKFFHISEEEMYVGESSSAPPVAAIPVEGTLSTSCPIFLYMLKKMS